MADIPADFFPSVTDRDLRTALWRLITREARRGGTTPMVMVDFATLVGERLGEWFRPSPSDYQVGLGLSLWIIQAKAYEAPTWRLVFDGFRIRVIPKPRAPEAREPTGALPGRSLLHPECARCGGEQCQCEM